MGIAHGAFCVGCCWSLMLVMFGVGLGSLPAMLALGRAHGRREEPALGPPPDAAARLRRCPGRRLLGRRGEPWRRMLDGPWTTTCRARRADPGRAPRPGDRRHPRLDPRRRPRAPARRRLRQPLDPAPSPRRRSVPLSQIHYHFGSKQQLILGRPRGRERRGSSSASGRCSRGREPLWRQWERACDYLDEDLESGYVRILQEMIAAGWSDAEVAAARPRVHGRLVRPPAPTSPRARRSGSAASGRSRPDEVGGADGPAVHGRRVADPAGRAPRPILPARSALRKVGALIRSLEERLTAAERWRRRLALRTRASRARREQSRARYPDATGFIERDGVRVVLGALRRRASPTILLMPTWSIVHSRHWKLQIPFLARRFRVVTFDGRGNGRSDRPTDRRGLRGRRVRRRRRRRHGRDRHRPGGRRGAVDGRGLRASGSPPTTRTASLGLCLIGPTVPVDDREPPERDADPIDFEASSTATRAGHKYNAHYWRRDWPGFAAFFFGEVLHRAALDQADRGHRRLGPRDRPRDDDHRRARAVPRPPATGSARRRATAERSCAACAVRPWSIHGTDDHITAIGIGRRGRGGARRAVRRARGRRPRPASAASPSWSNLADPRLRALGLETRR